MNELEQLQERNRKIKLIMNFFDCSYATAAQFYAGVRNHKVKK